MNIYPYQEARKGREKQKYDGETRLVVGCVAVRNHAILLVSSHNSADKWVLPKGGWEIDESEEDAAKRETFEEAGVTGDLGKRISEYTYMNKLEKPVRWSLFVMDNVKEYDWWPEKDHRSRRWFDIDDLSTVTLSTLTQCHVPAILQYFNELSRVF